jgi:hypothetical protein
MPCTYKNIWIRCFFHVYLYLPIPVMKIWENLSCRMNVWMMLFTFKTLAGHFFLFLLDLLFFYNERRYNLNLLFHGIFSKIFWHAGWKSYSRCKSKVMRVLRFWKYKCMGLVVTLWVSPSSAGQVHAAERQVSFKGRVNIRLAPG